MQEHGSAKVMRACLLMLCAIGMVLAGCASYTPPPANSVVLTLAKAEERTSRLGLRITFPAGDYIADFANESGVYYLAPSSVMFRNLGMSAPSRGGVFVPHATAKEPNQLAWGHVASATAIGAVLTAGSSINTYPLNEPLPLVPKPPAGAQK